jgi:hypothetical protein
MQSLNVLLLQRTIAVARKSEFVERNQRAMPVQSSLKK